MAAIIIIGTVVGWLQAAVTHLACAHVVLDNQDQVVALAPCVLNVPPPVPLSEEGHASKVFRRRVHGETHSILLLAPDRACHSRLAATHRPGLTE